jgi:lipoprotein-anchoring transpeptidase ErfK/SrfK
MRQELQVAMSAAAVAAATSESSPAASPPSQRFINGLHRHSRGLFTLLFLLVAIVGIEVGGHYWSARVINSVKPAATAKAAAPTIAGLNLTVPAKDLQAKLQTIANQPATLTVGSQTIPVGADTIRGWLQITASADKSENYIRIKSGTIAASLTQLANQFVVAPINQVTVNEDGTDRVVVGGRNGAALTNPDSLKIQAQQVAKTVMDGKGLQFSTPLQTAPFQSVTPAAYGKLLVADVTTKKMWAYQNGQQINSWLVSGGAPATPTPLGLFHIYAKYTVQDMRGFNPNGTKYFQPHVRWVDYFYEGSAIHGVYWHPLSWFGAINSSHGCVGLPEDQAQWIFNWAPIGTTVIVHD